MVGHRVNGAGVYGLESPGWMAACNLPPLETPCLAQGHSGGVSREAEAAGEGNSCALLPSLHPPDKMTDRGAMWVVRRGVTGKH